MREPKSHGLGSFQLSPLILFSLSSSYYSPYLRCADNKKGQPLLDCVVRTRKSFKQRFEEHLHSPYRVDHYQRGGHLTSFILSHRSVGFQGYTISICNSLTYSFLVSRGFTHQLLYDDETFFSLRILGFYLFCSSSMHVISSQISQ